MKKLITIAALFLLFLTALYFLWIRDEQYFHHALPVYKAVPPDSPAFAEINSLNKIPFNSPVIKEFRENEILSNFIPLTFPLDSLLLKYPEIKVAIGDEKIILVFSPAGGNSYAPLFIMKAEIRTKRKLLEKALATYTLISAAVTTSENYKGKKITQKSFRKNGHSLFYSFSDGLLILGFDQSTIKKAIDQLEKKGLADDQEFTRVNKTAFEDNGISFYINHKPFQNLLSGLFNPVHPANNDERGDSTSLNQLNPFIGLHEFASWSEFDLDLNEKFMFLNGISRVNDSLNQYFTLMGRQSPGILQTDRILPANTSFFLSIHLSDPSDFLTGLAENFKLNGYTSQMSGKLPETEKEGGKGIEELFRQTLGDELTAGTFFDPANPDEEKSFLIYRVKNPKTAYDQFRTWFKAYAEAGKIDLKHLSTEYKINRDQQFTIHNFPFPSAPGIFFGKPFILCDARFLTFLDDYLILTNDIQAMRDILLNISLNNTLKKDLTYNKIRQNINNQANITIYINPGIAFRPDNEVFSRNAKEWFRKHKKMMGKFQGITYQLVNTRGLLFNQMAILFDEKNRFNPFANHGLGSDGNVATGALWSCKLNNRVLNNLQLVVNHDDKNNREIMFQDEGNLLYQVSNDGKIRWTIPLNENIIGSVHQIDYFKNGKLQYLFNTKTKLYLIDRNGKNVSGFPEKFESPATNQVAVIDFDKNRDYKYFIAFENLKVEGFNRNGEKLKIWNFKATENPVSFPVQHFRTGRNDYLFFNDKSKVYILDRQGNEKVKISPSINYSANPLVPDMHENPKLVSTDIDGTVYFIGLSGKITKNNLGRFSNNHFFRYADLNADKKPEYIFLDRKTLSVFDDTGVKVFSREFDENNMKAPNIIPFADNLKKIGIVKPGMNEIFLINPDGSLYPGFPMAGSDGFTIGKMDIRQKAQNLIVAGSDGILYKFLIK